jgi:CheY-like chemotaxis protein
MDLGCAVVEAASLEEATALLADLPEIALVLSDIRLRGSGTGVDLARQIPDNGPPVVLMTSLPAQAPLRQEAARAYPILPKPFDVRQLSALLLPKARS